MRENLSAPGTVSDWFKITKQAFKNLNYYNITPDRHYARLTARYGFDDYITVNIRSKGNNRVLLEFDVSNPRLIDQFKTASAQIIRKIQNKNREKREEEEYGKIPVNNFNPDELPETIQAVNDYTAPGYVAEDGDFIEQTRILPDDTLQLKQFRKDLDRLEEDSFRHKFRQMFNKLWVIWLMLILLPPFGIFLLWYFKRMSLVSRILLSAASFLYFFLIWIGFFGIDTGFNRESIQKFYQTQQYNVQRFFDRFNPGTDPNQAIESVTPQEQTPTYVEPGTIQNDGYNPGQDVNSLFDGIYNFFHGIFSPTPG